LYRVWGRRGKSFWIWVCVPRGPDQRKAGRTSTFVGLGLFIIERFLFCLMFGSEIISDLKLFNSSGAAVTVRIGDRGHLGAPASRTALEHMAVMQNAIEHRGNGGNIS